MSLGAIHGNNLAYFALAIEEDSGFLAIKIDGPAFCSTAMKYQIEVMECINLRQYGGKLLAYSRGIVPAFLSQNMSYLGVGHTCMRVHYRLVKLVAANLTLSAYLHLTDHAQAIFCRI